MPESDAGIGLVLAVLAALMVPIVAIGFCAFIGGLFSGNPISFLVGCVMLAGSLFFLVMFIKEYRDGPYGEAGAQG